MDETNVDINRKIRKNKQTICEKNYKKSMSTV